MPSPEIHRLGVQLEGLVSYFGAYVGPSSEASNSADYYDYSDGLPHGVQACLEVLKSQHPDDEFVLGQGFESIDIIRALDVYPLHERAQEWTVVIALLELLTRFVPRVEAPEAEQT